MVVKKKMQNYMLIILALTLVGLIGSSSYAMVNTTATPPFLSGTLTTVDGTLVELEVDMTILRMPMGNKSNSFVVPKLTRIDYELAGGANILDAPTDEYTISITPNTQATHPHLNDREVMFLRKQYQQLATAATNSAIGKMMLTGYGYIRHGIVASNKIFIQVTLDGAAQAWYFRIEFEWVKISYYEVIATLLSQNLTL